MSASAIHLSWAHGVKVELDVALETLVLEGARRTVRIRRPPSSLLDAMRALEEGSLVWSAVPERDSGEGGPLAPWRWRATLQQLASDGWILATQRASGRVFVEQVPGVHGVRLPGPAPESPIALSRFALALPEDGQLVARSPASTYAVRLHDPSAASLFAAMATARSIAELAHVAGVSAEVARDAVSVFLAAGLASAPGDDPAPHAWDVHDLLFHARSRLGRHFAPTGATGRFEHLPAAPAVAPRSTPSSIRLVVPDRRRAASSEPPFIDVVEGRSSARSYGGAPLTSRALGELLYRCVRTRGVHGTGDAQVIDRPYPCAGALYEQEIYVVAHRVAGLDPGIYAYDGVRHALAPVSAAAEHTTRILDDAARAMNGDVRPDALLVVTARFWRVMRKYEGVAYALVLKNAGALLQTLSLVAEAMGLAGCPLGGGDAELFSAVLGTSFFEESSVAEFALGSRADAGERTG